TRYFCSMLQFYLAKIIKRSEFYYADFDYMMGMDCVNYRQLYTATGFSPIPKIDAKRQERQLQTQGRYMIRHIESV
ncbi:MAG: hypothetical protein ACOCOD_07145, partial [Prevotella sp.]